VLRRVNGMAATMSCMNREGGPDKPGRACPSTRGPSIRGTSDGGAADCLSLAAAPTFAVMALLTAVLGGGPLDMLCGASPLTGMIPMYVLMSAFHTAPWLKLISNRNSL
jgi:hypothetical protein